jgi:hypothetical protein
MSTISSSGFWPGVQAQAVARRAAILVCTLALSGCVNMAGDWYRIEPLINHGHGGNDSGRNGAFTTAGIRALEDAVTTPAQRNSYLERLLGRSEEICGKHLADVSGTGGSVGFGAGWFAAIFSALATANPGAAATNYAATATAINAGGSAFNANIYRGYITPGIVREIRKKRDAFFAAQVPALKASTLENFPATAATRVAIQFHEQCSFYNGLIEIATPEGKPPQK